MHTARNTTLIALVSALLSAACSTAPPLLDLTVSVWREEGGTFAKAPLRLYKDGRLVATAPSPDQDVPIGKGTAADPQPSFAVEMDLPCGPKQLPIEVSGLRREQDMAGFSGMPKEPQTVKRFLVRPKRPAGPTFQLWIDNRGGPKRTVGIGKFRFDVSENAKAGGLAAPVPECAEGAALTLDGKPVGAIPLDLQHELTTYSWSTGDPQERIERFSRDFLLDTSGARCYEFRWVMYKTAGYELQNPWLGGGRQEYYFRRKFLHRLIPGTIRHFLEPAPKKLEIREVPGTRALPGGNPDWANTFSRIQLTEVRCR